MGDIFAVERNVASSPREINVTHLLWSEARPIYCEAKRGSVAAEQSVAQLMRSEM